MSDVAEIERQEAKRVEALRTKAAEFFKLYPKVSQLDLLVKIWPTVSGHTECASYQLLQPIFAPNPLQEADRKIKQLEAENAALRKASAESSPANDRCESVSRGRDCTLPSNHRGNCSYT